MNQALPSSRWICISPSYRGSIPSSWSGTIPSYTRRHSLPTSSWTRAQLGHCSLPSISSTNIIVEERERKRATKIFDTKLILIYLQFITQCTVHYCIPFFTVSFLHRNENSSGNGVRHASQHSNLLVAISGKSFSSLFYIAEHETQTVGSSVGYCVCGYRTGYVCAQHSNHFMYFDEQLYHANTVSSMDKLILIFQVKVMVLLGCGVQGAL